MVILWNGSLWHLIFLTPKIKLISTLKHLTVQKKKKNLLTNQQYFIFHKVALLTRAAFCSNLIYFNLLTIYNLGNYYQSDLIRQWQNLNENKKERKNTERTYFTSSYSLQEIQLMQLSIEQLMKKLMVQVRNVKWVYTFMKNNIIVR